LNIHID